MQYEEYVLRDAWFASLPTAVQRTLLTSSRLAQYAPNEAIFRQGDPFSGLYCLLEGSVRMTCTTVQGDMAILAVFERPEWFGEVSLFDNKVRNLDAMAAVDTKVLHLSVVDIDRILNTNPAMWQYFGQLAVQKMRRLFFGLEAFALKSPDAWVARRLLMVARQNGIISTQRDAPPRSNLILVSQNQLAQMLAKTRQTTSQLLRRLETAGIIRCGYRHIEVLNWQSLLDAAEIDTWPAR